MTDTAVQPVHRHAPDWLILSIACVAQFMVVLDVSIVNVALPSIPRDLHFSVSGVQWVVNAYVLTFAGFLLLGGRAADLFGRRSVYLTGVAIFTIASIGAGFAESTSQMVAVRALQGFGGAILSPATLTIIVTTFHGPRLPKAIGAWSAVAGAGGAVGTLLGGILTGELSWRWIFYINVPIGIVAFIAASMYLREMRNSNATQKLDITGATLITASLGSLIYGIVNTTTYGWTSSTTLSWIIAAVIGLIVFAFWEQKVASHPIMPFRLFKIPSLTSANIVMMLVGGAFFGMWYFLTFYLQGVLHYSALRAGFAFAPMAMAIIIGAQISSRILQKTGIRPLLFVGTTMATLGFFWLSLIHPDSTYFTGVMLPACTCALAMGLLFSPLATAATSGIERSDAGVASGLLNTARQVGGSLALAALATIATSQSNSFASPFSSAAQTSGYQRAFQISAGITLLAFFGSWLMPKNAGLASNAAPALVE